MHSYQTRPHQTAKSAQKSRECTQNSDLHAFARGKWAFLSSRWQMFVHLWKVICNSGKLTDIPVVNWYFWKKFAHSSPGGKCQIFNRNICQFTLFANQFLLVFRWRLRVDIIPSSIILYLFTHPFCIHIRAVFTLVKVDQSLQGLVFWGGSRSRIAFDNLFSVITSLQGKTLRRRWFTFKIKKTGIKRQFLRQSDNFNSAWPLTINICFA